MWNEVENIKIREEAVGVLYDHHIEYGWNFNQVEKKNMEKCSKVLYNKILKNEAFQQWMLYELYCVALWPYVPVKYIFALMTSKSPNIRGLFCIHINYMFLINEQPSILPITDSNFLYIVVLPSSGSIGHSLVSKRTGKEREEDYHRRF